MPFHCQTSFWKNHIMKCYQISLVFSLLTPAPTQLTWFIRLFVLELASPAWKLMTWNCVTLARIMQVKSSLFDIAFNMLNTINTMIWYHFYSSIWDIATIPFLQQYNIWFDLKPFIYTRIHSTEIAQINCIRDLWSVWLQCICSWLYATYYSTAMSHQAIVSDWDWCYMGTA